ncbi:hypothetical protein BDQ17DRAFT_1429417 [Cyathus striatus]|nr:hypothetical protein BDQ17DRAFT_1429417 [Cyathus striatus]
MPIVQPGEKVLVADANRYLAIWTVQRLLDRGHSVRGTVCSEKKGTLYQPAVGGILSILKRFLNLPNIKQIVYTSTNGVIMKEVSEPTILSEKDWNNEAVEAVEDQWKEVSASIKNFASKLNMLNIFIQPLGTFMRNIRGLQHMTTLSFFPLIYLLLPSIHELGADPPSLGVSLNYWYISCVADPDRLREDGFLTSTTPWGDIRDIANAHITILEKEAASGERIIVSAGMFFVYHS